MSKAKDLRTKSADELAKTVGTLRSDLAEARRSHKMGELKNFSKLPRTRKEIARILTVQREVSTKENK
ncbi:MAG TPA: 50S ribosomal protein L29 [Candidatus Saccharimonadales bacterium]|nr:50S ribosomal protein L29 [Candidatus Saccharimonadales bacterium]